MATSTGGMATHCTIWPRTTPRKRLSRNGLGSWAQREFVTLIGDVTAWPPIYRTSWPTKFELGINLRLDQRYIQMHRITFAAAWLVVATIWDVSAQNHQEAGTNPTIYFPYPSGLMPEDLQPEIDRVNREVDQIFQETLARSRALPAPQLAGNSQSIETRPVVSATCPTPGLPDQSLR
jgi:hypothetical protein